MLLFRRLRLHFQRLPCSCTLVLTLHLHSPLMPPISQLVLSSSSSLTSPGNHWFVTVISYGHWNANTALSTTNCWHCIWQCGTFIFCWRVTLSPPTLTTSRYHLLSPRSWIPGHQDNSSIWLSSSMQIRHIAGKDNCVADVLQHSLVNALCAETSVNFSALVAVQHFKLDMMSYVNSSTGLHLQQVPFGDASESLLCDVSTGHSCLIVPHTCHCQFFDAVHGLAHPLIHATSTLIMSKFVWHHVRKDIHTWARLCILC